VSLYSDIVKHAINWFALLLPLLSQLLEIFLDPRPVVVFIFVVSCRTVFIEVVVQLQQHRLVACHVNESLKEDLFLYFSKAAVDLDEEAY